MREYDFKNEDYSVEEFLNDVRTDGETALWATNSMSPYELVRIFVREWDKAMEEKKNE